MKALDWRAGGQTALVIDAPPHQVYDVIADITRIGERSSERRTAAWIGDDTSAVAGARFRGHHRVGVLARWPAPAKSSRRSRKDPGPGSSTHMRW